ncbi:MAG TPA: 2-dehydropantoate 2-reductase [Terracidiphilus sp.]|nr:2-dehydropantoate 2-reductase [Terracidiphilus sp.]
MRVAIVGVGAIGGALTGLLDQTGRHDLTLCTRRPMPQLTVTWPDGETRVRGRNLTASGQADSVDWIIVATKTYDAEGAAAWFPALCAKGAPVAVVQNGVEHRERFLPYVTAERLLPVIINCPVERPADGEVHVRGACTMKVEDSPLARGFAALFAGTAATVELVPDFVTAAWYKLCINAAGVLCALTQKPTRVLWSDPISSIASGIVEECAAVGRAEGALLDADTGRRVLDHYRGLPADSVNSLLADRLAGRCMEVDARNGVIVRKGEKHGIPTPLNRMAAVLLEAI